MHHSLDFHSRLHCVSNACVYVCTHVTYAIREAILIAEPLHMNHCIWLAIQVAQANHMQWSTIREQMTMYMSVVNYGTHTIYYYINIILYYYIIYIYYIIYVCTQC